MNVVVNFIKGYTPYAKGDATRMPEEEAKKLEEAGILKIGGIVANKETVQEPLKDENLKGEEYQKEQIDVVIPTTDKKKRKKSKKTAK